VAAAEVRAALEELADPERAAFVAPYLGVRPGDYGDGDTLLGMPVPAQRAVARRFRDLPLPEVAALLASPVHEHRFVALAILCDQHRRGDAARRAELTRFYLDHRAAVDNWDLVDASARQLVGVGLVEGGDRSVLWELVESERLWDRRIAIVSTHALIQAGDLSETFSISERLLDDPHHLMWKATGWMLREAGKRDEPALVAWLDDHRAAMPRTMLRYAIERLDPGTRARLMAR
jgi:3-methyladenine DNA glycosylase AlkD